MRRLECVEDAKIVVNGEEISCPTCKNQTYTAILWLVNCENGYRELHVRCNCCGKVDIYDYRYARGKINPIKGE